MNKNHAVSLLISKGKIWFNATNCKAEKDVRSVIGDLRLVIWDAG
jgi:hypothetical protein